MLAWTLSSCNFFHLQKSTLNASNAIQIVSGFTMQQESFSPVPYPDQNGLAIGYGNHYWQDGSPITADDTISQADAVQLLQDTLVNVYNAIAPCIAVGLTDNQLAGLLDLAYNWGAGNFCNSVLLQLINSGASAAAIDAQWQKTAITAGGVYSQTLYNRRGLETQLFDTLSAVVNAPGAGALLALGVFVYLVVTRKIKL